MEEGDDHLRLIHSHIPLYAPTFGKVYSRKFVPSIELLLNYRLCWLRGGHGVGVAMYDLPLADFFWPEDHRDPQGDGGNILACSDLGPGPLHPHDVGKLVGHVFFYGLEADYLAVSEPRCCALPGRGDLVPPTHGRAIGVGEGYVFSR